MTYEELERKVADGEYEFHHSAMHHGYLGGTNTKKGYTPNVNEYKGRFGKGYTVEYSCWWVSTMYHFVDYYIINE